MREQIKAVIDTSVLISGAISKSNTSSSKILLRSCDEGFFKIVTSPQMLEELALTLKKCEFSKEKIENFIGFIIANAITTEGLYTTDKLNDIDPKDNMIFSTAYESGADYIVSLDRKHILPFKHYYKAQIITPSAFITEFENFKLGIKREYQEVIY